MNRRNFIKTSGFSLAAALTCEIIPVSRKDSSQLVIKFPDAVAIILDGRQVALNHGTVETWSSSAASVCFAREKQALSVSVEAPHAELTAIVIRWDIPTDISAVIMNDQWERTYGDVSWHRPDKTEILPWYFLEKDGPHIRGFGVKTGAGAFCHWQINPGSLKLILDIASGGGGVRLGDRTLKAAEIVTLNSRNGESPFQAARQFTRLMCDQVRMPRQPVYGINDWYFSYGNNSAELILDHTERMSPLADDSGNRPFSVIDAGWFRVSETSPGDSSFGNMGLPNDKFGDMALLANKIKNAGMRPGLWTRPLCGSVKDTSLQLLPPIAGRESGKPILDPTIPENLERIKNYFQLYRQWGYELVKFDYTSFDLFGKWGFQMIRDASITQNGWHMNDTSRTNAEIVLGLYRAIREAAGEMYIISCNTFSHLAAGLFELNRIGDDTSGREWQRTRKMGVNTLAFRGIQHGHFYATDADCVGLTTDIPWEKNRQWLQLLAESGTPLFISAQAEAMGTEQKDAIRQSFREAAKTLPLGEPLDLFETATPARWKLNGKTVQFTWD